MLVSCPYTEVEEEAAHHAGRRLPASGYPFLPSIPEPAATISAAGTPIAWADFRKITLEPPPIADLDTTQE